MISKEMLSEVLNITAIRIGEKEQYIYGSIMKCIWYLDINDKYRLINVYEFAHLCKKWANNLKPKRYQIYSRITKNNGKAKLFSGGIKQREDFIASTEAEAIFQACNWVFKKIKE